MPMDVVNRQVAELRRQGTALAMIAAPLVFGIGQALQPDLDVSSGEKLLVVVVNDTGRATVAMFLTILGLAIFLPAVLGVTGLLRARGAWLGLIGGCLAGLGLVFEGAFIGAMTIAPLTFAEVPAAERAGLVPGLQALVDQEGAMGWTVIGPVAFSVSLVLLGIGLFRARTVARWAAVVVAAGGVGMFVGVDHWIRTADAVFLLVGLGAIGLGLLRRPAGRETTSDVLPEGVQTARP
jgi:hypothetical protein